MNIYSCSITQFQINYIYAEYYTKFCWIKRSGVGNIWRWLCFYVPLWLCILTMMAIYSQVWNQIALTNAEASATSTHKTGTVPVKPSESNLPTTVSTTAVVSSTQTVMTTTASNAMMAGEHHQPQTVTSMQSMQRVISDTGSPVVTRNETVSAVQSHDDDDDGGGGGGGGGGAVASAIVAAQRTSSGSAGGGSGRSGTTLSRIKYYPVILFGCYFFATVRRLVELIDDDPAPLALAAVQVVTTSLLVFF